MEKTISPERQRNIEIGTNIRNQIGNQSLSMLGAKDVYAIENGLSFKVRGSKKINYIKITLNSMDTYDMEFGLIRNSEKAEAGFTYKIVNTENGIYDDMLNQIIEKNTGLYTKLF